MALLATNRSYRFLFSASAISNLGDGISALAFPWLATLITRDPFLIALVAFAGRLPWFLFSIPAGVITDRYDRRTLMVRADMFRLILTFGVIGLILQAPTLPLAGEALHYILALSGIALLLGTAEVLRDNAAQTVLPSIVSKSDLETANGQMWSIEQIMGSFVGPPLAGVLIAWAVPAPFVVDAVSFGLAAWLVWMIALPKRAAPTRRHIMVEVREGWAWMRAHPVVLRLAVMLGLINALFTMTLTVLILFSQDILGLSAVQHGVLLTAGAAGGVAGGMIGPRVVARLGQQRCIHIAQALMIAPFVMIAMTSNPYVVAAALFLEMVSGMLWNVITVSYRQRLIPDDLLGRVNSIYRFFGWGMMPVGALAAGILVAWFEPGVGREAALRLPFIIGTVGTAILFVYGLAKLRL
ncbi:MFS transporter [Octadecabacter sp. G9-8]|uniref:MFS transporter n=1 Tax=Octadecabacter dasysiphoniae TaxID=2909341 RepID=A0ABS9CTL8_9RHOB|nr:MFS transporter [Octadecabacter dasysiphoniae]MCF2870189.1 MFS transporter [Octadecabacter dasysiphoniae]